MLQLKMRFDALHEKAPASFAESWSYFLEMQQAQLLEHLALFSYSTGRDQLYHADHLATALGTDPATHVILNNLGYFNHTAKKHILSMSKPSRARTRRKTLPR